MVKLIENKIYKRIKHAMGKAIHDFDLIEEGDRIAVGLSGGKDSYTLLHILDAIRHRAPVKFEIMAITIDSGYSGYRSDVIAAHARESGFDCHVEVTNHYEVISEKRDPGSSYCSFCSRLKRGSLYTLAQKFGCNKLALGHHLDDFIETLLLNQFYTGSIKAMAPSMLADNGVTTVIRPLVYAEERDILALSCENHFPVVCCCCPVCGVADLKRRKMKSLIAELQKENEGIKRSMIKALSNVQPRHLLDQRLTQTWSSYGTRKKPVVIE